MTERTKPLAFVVESFSVHVDGSWVAEVQWSNDDGCFVLEDVHNYSLAPCDLEELARVLRAIPRHLPPPSVTVEAPSPAAGDGGSSGA